MEIKITKRKKLLEINNNMCHNYYYLVCGRFYNDDKTRYRKFKFIPWFDNFDVAEYFYGNDIYEVNDILITQDMIEEYLEECIWYYVSSITEYDNKNQLKHFYECCNYSIRRYNEIAKHW